MGRDDWYRNDDWNPDIEAAFFGRLKKSRSERAQYLKIQAQYLTTTHPEVALSLIQRYFETGDDFLIAPAHVIEAEACKTLGLIDEAIESYRLALKQEEVFPYVQTSANVDLALLIAKQGRKKLYTLAAGLLQRSEPGVPFHRLEFESQAALALMARDEGNHEAAAEHASIALEHAKSTNSGLRYHPTVGLVGDAETELRKELESMANSLPRRPAFKRIVGAVKRISIRKPKH